MEIKEQIKSNKVDYTFQNHVMGGSVKISGEDDTDEGERRAYNRAIKHLGIKGTKLFLIAKGGA